MDNNKLENIFSEFSDEEKESDLKELFSNENIEKKTDLSNNQVLAMTKARIFADRYDNDIIKDFIQAYSTFAVSKERKGRTEFVESYKAKILEPLGLGGGFGVKENEKD